MADVIERENRTEPFNQSERREDGGEGLGMPSKALIGAAAGAVGVWALDRADWLMWKNESEEARLRTNAVRPYGEPPAHVLVSRAEEKLGLDPTPEQHELAGAAVHYGIGIGPAVAYALFRDKLPVSGPLRGALFGLGLFAMQDEVLNAASGLGAKPQKYPWQAHARGLISHVVFGIATEMALDLMERSVKARGPGAASGGEPQGKPRAIRS